MTDNQPAAAEERNESNIHFVRGQKIMLGMHLAEAYGIEPQVLGQAVERNIGHFPQDSVFRLKPEEFVGLKLRHAISGQAAPYAFTRQGVATLSCMLFDEREMHEDWEACAPTCSCRK